MRNNGAASSPGSSTSPVSPTSLRQRGAKRGGGGVEGDMVETSSPTTTATSVTHRRSRSKLSTVSSPKSSKIKIKRTDGTAVPVATRTSITTANKPQQEEQELSPSSSIISYQLLQSSLTSISTNIFGVFTKSWKRLNIRSTMSILLFSIAGKHYFNQKSISLILSISLLSACG